MSDYVASVHDASVVVSVDGRRRSYTFLKGGGVIRTVVVAGGGRVKRYHVGRRDWALRLWRMLVNVGVRPLVYDYGNHWVGTQAERSWRWSYYSARSLAGLEVLASVSGLSLIQQSVLERRARASRVESMELFHVSRETYYSAGG